MCDEGRHSFPALQSEARLLAPMVQSGDRAALVAEGWDAAIRRAAATIAESKLGYGAGSIGAIVGARATNEEAWALKRLLSVTIGSDQIGAISYSPKGASGNDNLLIRANKNPNTRGLSALGLSLDGADRLAASVASGELKVLIALRADLVRALGEAEFVRRFGPLDYLIVLDTDANETGQMANQALPIAAYPELDGSFTNFQGRVQRLHKAFDPPGEALAATEVIAHLSHALDGVSRASAAEVLFAEMAASEPAFKGLSLGSLSAHGSMLAALTAHASATAARP
jgi:predicted molibdopterin-dependent oxidoreductase YjgC